ncbi:MAG: galactosyltransferase-related protein [Planctomycetota bacterium]
MIISTYERPRHLERCLHSLACQQGVAGRFDAVVTDDGSTDGTADLVADFARTAAFPVGWVTQPQAGFRLARCRNNGVRASSAPYLLFTDGDCVFPADHLATHLSARRQGVVRAGDCARLNEVDSERVDFQAIEREAFVSLADQQSVGGIRRLGRKAKLHQLIGSRKHPKLVGANIGVWRSDFERVNGFDEAFVGWGCEDDDFAHRLRKSGVRARTIVDRTLAYHLWHPPHPSTPGRWKDGPNVHRLIRRSPLARCLVGLDRRGVRDLAVRVVNRRYRWFHAVWPNLVGAESPTPCDVELLVLPGEGRFRGDGLRVVVAPEAMPLPPEVADASSLVVRTPAPVRTPDELFSAVGQAVRNAA